MESYLDRIKLMKNEKKMTNEQLAERTGIPLGTLSKILAGMSDSPKLSNIIAICNALDCSVEYIVSGTPENTNNYTLSADEIAFIEDYRQLDTHGRELISLIAQKELDRVGMLSEPAAKVARVTREKKPSVAPVRTAKILPTPAIDTTKTASSEFGRMTVLLYDLPVSAGPGVYLDDSIAEEISIPSNEKTSSTDFALRISGNSMEPKYHDGDIVLVEDTDSVEIGELGIFVLDGNGYFKKFGGDRLISLNEEYGDILLRDYAEAVCCGRVIGKLKRK